MSKWSNLRNNGKRKSISAKISLSLLAVLVPLLIVLIVISCMMAASSIGKLNDKLLSTQTDYAVSIVDDFFNGKASAVSMFDHNFVFEEYFKKVWKPSDIESYPKKKEVLELLSNALKNMSSANVEQVWVADQKTDQYLLSTGEVVKASLAGTEWAGKVVSGKSTVITEPFLDPATGKQIISIVSPVFSGSDVVGFVGFDVFLDSLSITLSEIEVGEEGYLELLSRDSNYIYSDDVTAMGKNVMDLDITDVYKNNVKNKFEGSMDFSYAGVSYTSISSLCGINDWLAIATLPMAEVNETRNHI